MRFLLAALALAACGGGARTLADGDQALLEGEPERAVELYRSLVGKASDQRSAEALLRIARVRLDISEQPADAEKILRELVARFPQSEAAYEGQVLLVGLYRDVYQDPVRVVPEALRAIEMRPGGLSDDWLRWVLAQGYTRRGDFAQARIELEQLLELHPHSQRVPEAELEIARSFELQGAVVTASERYETVERAHPGHPVAVQARLGRARMLEALDDLENAERLYVECLGFGPNRPAVGARLLALRERRERRLAGAPTGP